MLEALLWFFLGTLHKAAHYDDVRRVDAYLERGWAINEADSRGRTPLHCAAAAGSVSGARLLLEHGADIDALAPGGGGALHLALTGGHAEMALFLIAQGADVHQAAAGGITPLHLACRSGMTEVATALLDNGAKVNALTGQGQTPLFLALAGLIAEGNDAACVTLLFAAGADPRLGAVSLIETACLDVEACTLMRGELEALARRSTDPGMRAYLAESLALLRERGFTQDDEQDGTAVLAELADGAASGGESLLSDDGLFFAEMQDTPESGAVSSFTGEDGASALSDVVFQETISLLNPAQRAALDSLVAARGTAATIHVKQENGVVTALAVRAHPDALAWTIPDTIGAFTGLRALFLDCTGLRAPLPWGIAQLKSLEELRLQNYPFPSLPERVFSLPNLRHLSVAGGSPERLPERLGRLGTLQTLHIERIPLTSLPESLGRLERLHTLRVIDTALAALPASLGKLRRLERCVLSGNRLRVLPDSIGLCTMLRELDLGRNALETVPATLFFLTRLEAVSLHGNGISGPIPPAVFAMPRLRYLNLSENAFSGAVPDALTAAPALQSLILTANPGLSGTLPPCMTTEKTQVVALSETGLVPAPEDAAAYAEEWSEAGRLARLALHVEEKEDSRGRGLTLPRVPSPLLLREEVPGWFRSQEKSIGLWGGSYAFYLELETLQSMTGMDADEVEERCRQWLPAAATALEQLAAADRETLLLAVAEAVFPQVKPRLRYGTLEDCGEVPIRSAADLARHLHIASVTVILQPGGEPRLELSLETYEFVFGGGWLQVTVRNGSVERVDLMS